jgi:23S rRNA (uracil1939-C5)-methyltransferase
MFLCDAAVWVREKRYEPHGVVLHGVLGPDLCSAIRGQSSGLPIEMLRRAIAAARSIVRVPRRPVSTRPAPPDPDEILRCRHFGTCGGCSLLDQPIRWQLHDKVAACERQLAPWLGGVRIEFIEPERPPRHFRTRLLYPVLQDGAGRPIVGLYSFRSHDLVQIDECRTQDAWLTQLGRAAERVLRDLKLHAFDARRQQGNIKAIWARLASGTGEVLAGIVTRPGAFAEGPAFATAMIAAAKSLPRPRVPRHLQGVVHSISDGDDEFLLGDRQVPLRGADHVIDRRDGLAFRISAGSFYQIHADAHELLYRPALAMCGDVRGQRVVDTYGGVGAFGLRLAKAGATEVTIVEEGAAACRDAEHNATLNRLAGVKVVRSPVASTPLPRDADLMVLDPPRAGLQAKACERVLAAAPRRLLYVSCSPESLARDLAALMSGGYRVTAARLCDLFPHTEHCELVVALTSSIARDEVSTPAPR